MHWERNQYWLLPDKLACGLAGIANLQLGKFYVKLDGVTEARELRAPSRHATFFLRQKSLCPRAPKPRHIFIPALDHIKTHIFSAIIQRRGLVTTPLMRRLVYWDRTIDRRYSLRFSDKLPETPRPINLQQHFTDTQVRFVKNSNRYYATPLSPPQGKIPDRN